MGFAFFTDGIRRYAQFDGRATRQQFWMFFLWKMLLFSALAILDSAFGFETADGRSVMASLFGLFVLLPSIAIGVRRLHDIGKSGWLMLLELIPLLGWLILVVAYWTKQGDSGANAYGPPAGGPIMPVVPPTAPPTTPA